MNDTYFHLTLTHIPIVGSFIALLLLFSGFIQKNNSIIKAGLYLLVGLALITIAVNHTGEEAEEFVEHLPGYSHHAIHEHEEMAEWAFRLMILTGLGAAASIFMLRRNPKNARPFILLVLIATLVTCGLMAWTGKKGGEIRHTEVHAQSENSEPASDEQDAD